MTLIAKTCRIAVMMNDTMTTMKKFKIYTYVGMYSCEDIVEAKDEKEAMAKFRRLFPTEPVDMIKEIC